MNNWFKVYIVDIIPSISVAVYTLGVVYNLSYFSSYGVNVLHFITLSELLIAIVEPLIIISLSSLFVFMAISYYGSYMSDFWEALRKRDKSDRDGGLPVENLADSYVNLLLRNKFLRTHIYPLHKKMVSNNAPKKNANNNNVKYVLFVVSLIVCVGLVLAYDSQSFIPNYTGMAKATIALSLLTIVYLLLFIPRNLWSNKSDSVSKNYASMEIASSVFFFYLTAVVVFYKAGKETAQYNESHDEITFVFKTSGGQQFDNESYIYIEQLNEDVFLCERSTKDVVILNKENIESTKINFNKKKSGSLFEEFRQQENI